VSRRGELAQRSAVSVGPASGVEEAVQGLGAVRASAGGGETGLEADALLRRLAQGDSRFALTREAGAALRAREHTRP
jgi:hypothetical protein